MRTRSYKDQFSPWVGFYSVLAVRPEDLATVRLLSNSFSRINESTENAAKIANEFIEGMIYAQ